MVKPVYDIYSNARSDSWRFTLGKTGERTLLTIGLNPSTATKEKSDTTVAKVERVAIQKGYDGFVMLNLYPVRATNFGDLRLKPNGEAVEENLRQIESVVTSQTNPVIWAAWGNSILTREFFIASAMELFKRLRKHGATWQHFGPLTMSGHPRHPSRLRYTWKFSPLKSERYVRTLGS